MKGWSNVRRSLIFVLSILVIFFTILDAKVSYIFKIYGSSKCPHCLHEKRLLSELFPDSKVEFHEVSKRENAKVFERVYQKVFPDEKGRYIPLVVAIRNGELFAVCVGAQREDFWKSAVENRRGVYIKFPGKKLRIEEVDLSDIEELEIRKKSIGEIFSICVASALLDAVNPCAFNVLLVFLTLMVLNIGVRRKVLQSGLAFTVATFVVYYLMGLGLLNVIEGLQWIKYVLYGFALWIGSMEMINGLRGKEWSPIPAKWKDRVSRGLEMILSPVGALLIGGFVGVVLLPCTSGPYVVALSALCGVKGFMRYTILTIYNLIFVFPFIALTLLVAFGLRTSKLKKFKSKVGRVVEILTGGALVGLVIVSLIFGF